MEAVSKDAGSCPSAADANGSGSTPMPADDATSDTGEPVVMGEKRDATAIIEAVTAADDLRGK